MFSNVLEIDGYKIYYIETSQHPFKIDKEILDSLSPMELVRVFYKNEYYEAYAVLVRQFVKKEKNKYVIGKEHFGK